MLLIETDAIIKQRNIAFMSSTKTVFVEQQQKLDALNRLLIKKHGQKFFIDNAFIIYSSSKMKEVDKLFSKELKGNETYEKFFKQSDFIKEHTEEPVLTERTCVDSCKPKEHIIYPSWCCPKCGENIGWLGRFIDWITQGHWHWCKEAK